MQYSNADILSAILNRFLQPVVIQFAQAKMNTIPFVQSIQNKLISSGWVSPSWNITNEISPLIEPITGKIVGPMIKKYVSSIPDEAIPEMAHSFVDNAIANNGIVLMEGKLRFEKSDMEELKKLLNYNLPLQNKEEYQVITTEPQNINQNGAEVTTDTKQAL